MRWAPTCDVGIYSRASGKPGSLSDQQAWDVAAWINRHERPQDPRLVEGSVEKTRVKFHANDGVNLYGQKVDGVLVGQGPVADGCL